MRFLFTSYVSSPGYTDPALWLKRIEGYTGILEALAKSHEVFSIEHIAYDGTVERNNVTYRFVNFGENFHRSPAGFHRLIKEMKPHVVFINGFNFPLQIIQLKMTVGRKTKIIVLHRAERPFQGIKKWVQKMADRCVDAYLFTSNEFAVDWKKNISADKIHEVIQGSSIFLAGDKIHARKKLDLPEGDVIFLWVGALIQRKDPLATIKGFIEFSKNQHNAKLYMIYQTNDLLPEVRSLVEKENAKERIALVGKIEHEDLGGWYNAADFIVSGSHHEGSGIAVVEAMSCGCIPILSNITSFRRMTGPGKCGFLFEPGSPVDLVEKLKAATNIDLQKERTKVLEQFHAELSFDAIAKKINCITGYQTNARHIPTT
jgi:glycosyltransferase involved in cell wall biosynthesis